MSESGFNHAPLSKGLFFTTLGCSLLARNIGAESWRGGSLPAQLGASLVLASTHEICVGMMLLYKLRTLERRMGTSRYAALCLWSGAAGTLAKAALLSSASVRAAAGPHLLIFGALPSLLRETPVVQPSATLRTGTLWCHADRLIVWVCCVQLAWGRGATTWWAAACGLAPGLLYTALLGRGGLDLPSFVSDTFGALLLPLIETVPSPAEEARNGWGPRPARAAGRGGGGAAAGGGAQQLQQDQWQQMPGQGGWGDMPGPAGGAPAEPIGPPSEDDIASLQRLVPMRSRMEIIAALNSSGRNTELAANALLFGD